MRRLLVPALAAALLLTGCTSQGSQVQEVDGTTQWKHPSVVVDFAGPTSAGSTFRSVDQRGHVLVVNFWYEGCGPCNAEAPVLRSLSQRFANDGVQFVGINTEDGRAGAQAFERQYGIAYPSILDQSNDSAAQLAFQGTVGPRTIPSTIVLDRKGRVSARIISQVSESVLRTFIQDALDGTTA